MKNKVFLDKKIYIYLLISGIGLILTACSLVDFLPGLFADQDAVQETQAMMETRIAEEAAKAVELTVQAMVTDTPVQAVATDTPQATGGISGALGYPSSFIPPLRVVAFNLDNGEIYDVDTVENQTSYEITGLPPGRYHVVAYVQAMGAEIPGGYSEFVLCGLHIDCQDHQLVEVIVQPGQVVEDVDPVDFYIEPDEAGWPEEPAR